MTPPRTPGLQPILDACTTALPPGAGIVRALRGRGRAPPTLRHAGGHRRPRARPKPWPHHRGRRCGTWSGVLCAAFSRTAAGSSWSGTSGRSGAAGSGFWRAHSAGANPRRLSAAMRRCGPRSAARGDGGPALVAVRGAGPDRPGGLRPRPPEGPPAVPRPVGDRLRSGVLRPTGLGLHRARREVLRVRGPGASGPPTRPPALGATCRAAGLSGWLTRRPQPAPTPRVGRGGWRVLASAAEVLRGEERLLRQRRAAFGEVTRLAASRGHGARTIPKSRPPTFSGRKGGRT